MKDELEKRIDEQMRIKKFKVFQLEKPVITVMASIAKVVDGDVVFYIPNPNEVFALDEGVPWMECARFRMSNIIGYKNA